jgi:hypothetical protein
VNLLSVLAVAERIIYFFVALTLIVPIVMLFVSVAMSMLQVSEAGILQTVLAILDRVLLVWNTHLPNILFHQSRSTKAVLRLLAGRR